MIKEGFNDARVYLGSPEWQNTLDRIGYTAGQALGYLVLTGLSVALFILGAVYTNLGEWMTSEDYDGLSPNEMAAIYGIQIEPDEPDGTPVAK